MKKTFLIFCLIISFTSFSQSMSPNDMINKLVANTTLDNMYYDSFYSVFGKPEKITNEDDGGKSLTYVFENTKSGSIQEISFVCNSYGKVTSILYTFPSSYEESFAKKMTSILSVLNKKTWYNARQKLLYAFMDLSSIGIESNKKSTTLFISIQSNN